VKLLTIAGKMLVAQAEKMNISGIWPLINYMATVVLLPASAPSLPAARVLLPKLLLRQAQAKRHQPAAKARNSFSQLIDCF